MKEIVLTVTQDQLTKSNYVIEKRREGKRPQEIIASAEAVQKLQARASSQEVEYSRDAIKVIYRLTR